MAPLQQLQEQTSGAHVSPAQHTGLIDLVGVTEAYCGAIQAADQRADIASSDSALAQARAETADLKRQLQVKLLTLGVLVYNLLCLRILTVLSTWA